MSKSNQSVCIVLWLGLMMASLDAGAETISGREVLKGTWQGQEVEFVAREILIGLKADRSQNDVARTLTTMNLTITRQADERGFMKVRTTAGTDMSDIIDSLAKLPAVRYAEPNLIERECVIPNDSLFDKQWHYHNTGQDPPGGTVDADIDAVEAWDITTGGQPVKVGVLDTGIPLRFGELSHPDLDDTTRFFLGYDFINDDPKPTDDRGHGAHVIGTIAAETDNGTGVAGVCWNAQILAIKVFNENGSGTSEAFRDGCIYAVQNGCRVINYSGSGPANMTKEEGVAYADTHGVVICASAGNMYGGDVRWPAAYSLQYDNVIAVSSTDHNDQISQFSSIGPEVVVSAPGGFGSDRDENDVLSTYPNYRAGLNGNDTSGYGYLAGTSMAAPHVAGLAALLISYEPDLTPALVRQILVNSAEDLGTPGFDNQHGWGRINAQNALAELDQVTILHQLLPDTRDTANDYEVVCKVLSAPPLTQAPELHFKVGAAEGTVSMLPTGLPAEYLGYIPAQPPLTSVDYWISAANTAGNSDVTDTFSFNITSHGVRMWPPDVEAAHPDGSLLQFPLWVVNEGLLADTFDLSLTAGWSGAIYDSLGLLPISSTPQIQPGDSVKITIEIEVPSLPIGTVDEALLTARSRSDTTQVSTARVVTTVSAAVLSPPLADEFSNVDSTIWLQVFECHTVATGGFAIPSPSRYMFFDDSDFGGDTLKSQPLDFSGTDSVLLRFYLQRRMPAESDTFKVDFLDSNHLWVNIYTEIGGEPYYQSDFLLRETVLPRTANHDAFQIRFTSAAQPTFESHGWGIDDFEIGFYPERHFQIIPRTQVGLGLAGDTIRSIVTVVNKGSSNDRYGGIHVNGDWNATFWDSTGAEQIVVTDYIDQNDSVNIMVKVAITPDTSEPYFTYTMLDIYSSRDPSEKRHTNIPSRSGVIPTAIPLLETFSEYSDFWLYNRGVLLNGNPAAPSYPDCLNMDGAYDTVIFDFFDLSAYAEVFFSYYYQRGGGYDNPEVGENLRFEYTDTAGQWRLLNEHLGGDPPMASFEVVALPLPPDALHDRFQFRITSNGSGYSYDDWWVDDLSITTQLPFFSVSEDTIHVSLDRGDSSTAQLIVANTGGSGVNYRSHVEYLGIVFQAGKLGYSDRALSSAFKGEPDTRVGPPVHRTSGSGPGAIYVWRDSDDPDGPTFDWIDIQGSGTPIAGLADDNFSNAYSLGMYLPYYDKTATLLRVGSNGLIGLGSSYNLESFDNQLLPSRGAPDGLLAWCWKDLDIDNVNNPDGAVYYVTSSNKVIIQFVNYPEYGGGPGDVINAQVILELDGTITYQYLSIDSGFETTDCTVGLEDDDGLKGVNVVFNNEYLHDSLAIQFVRTRGWLTMPVDSGTLGPGESDTLQLMISAVDLDSADYHANLVVSSGNPLLSSDSAVVPVKLSVAWGIPFLCGDLNLDNDVNILDLSVYVDYLFRGGPAPPRLDGADINNDGDINVLDLTYVVDYLFRGGPDPVCE